MAIRFFSETDKFNFRNKRKTSTWLKNVINSYGKIPGSISIIFCSDEQLLEINKSYLKHFYYTDVITFNYNEGNVINGDIYMSIERVADNSCIFNVSLQQN
ncbi:MAG: rRNA maturation RNase YbeY [Bacteroidales bacterium]|nr:rRNA maturation RNase YbeY [Bacteroidales bacterium]